MLPSILKREHLPLYFCEIYFFPPCRGSRNQNECELGYQYGWDNAGQDIPLSLWPGPKQFPCLVSIFPGIRAAAKIPGQTSLSLVLRHPKTKRLSARMYLQTPLPLPEFFPIGQWNRFKSTEVDHLIDPLALKLVRNGTKVFLTGSLMGFVTGCNVIFSNHPILCSVMGSVMEVL